MMNKKIEKKKKIKCSKENYKECPLTLDKKKSFNVKWQNASDVSCCNNQLEPPNTIHELEGAEEV